MDQLEIEGLLKDLNTRTTRIEQKLPTLAITSDVREEAERTRDRITNLGRDIRWALGNHQRRITALEANTPESE